MESCGMNMIKYILFIFNLIFAISGVGIIIAGAVVLADVGEFSHFVEGRLLAPPIVLIVAGAIVFLVAFLGCYGAIRESRNMLLADVDQTTMNVLQFAGCLLVIFIVELAVGIAAACYKADFQIALKSTLRMSLANTNNMESDKQAWQNVQTKLMCCGVDGPTDWLTDGPDRALPVSCCFATRPGATPPTEAQCRQAQPQDSYVYQTGCYDRLHMKMNQAADVLIGVGIGIAFVEIVGIVLACWLASAIKKEEEDGK